MSFWRTEDPQIGRDGSVIVGGMWPHQRRWWSSPAYIRALVTGYGGGKTLINAKRAIALSLHNNGAPHLVVSPSYKIAKRTIIPTIIELLDGRRLNYTYNKSDFEFLIKYHGRTGIVWVGSGDQPNSLRGPNLGSASIDEPFIQDRAVFNQMLARVRHPKARHREITLTGTPESLNWGYDICEGEERDKFDLELIQASTKDNKAAPAQFIKTMCDGYDDLAVQAYVNGKFVLLDSGLIYRSFDFDANICNSAIDDSQEIFVGIDFNVNPMSAVLAQWRGDEFHVCEEIVIRNSDTQTLAKEIISRHPKSIFTLHPDASGKNRSSKGRTDFIILSECFTGKLNEMGFPSKNPFVRDRFNCVNAAFCSASGKRRLFINNNCKELLKDMRLATHPYDDFKRKNPLRTHVSDALGYMVLQQIPLGRRPELVIS